jgi:sugar O-acyltransferase (sialic acid O-acetyltransferase NeuD family)
MGQNIITAEKFNASDSSYKILIHLEDGAQVKSGEVICDIETSKSTFEIICEHSGFIYFNPEMRLSQFAKTGDTIAIIDDLDSTLEVQDLFIEKANLLLGERPSNFTRKAFEFCVENGIDLSNFVDYELVTLDVVSGVSGKLDIRAKEISTFTTDIQDNRIIILGAGGQGMEILDIINKTNVFDFVGFVDPSGASEYFGHRILGNDDHLDEIRAQGIKFAAIAAGWLNIDRTKKLIEKVLKAGFNLPNLVHPTAYVYPTAKLLGGVQVFANSVVGANAEIGFASVVQNLALISHDSKIGRAVFIAPGAKIAGNVKVGDFAIIGMNASVYLRVEIESERIVLNNESVF